MALNVAVFKTRALTAILFVIVMLCGLLLNGYSFVLLLLIIHFGCWFEFIRLLKKINPTQWLLYAFTGIVYITLPIVLLLLMGLVFTFDDGHFINQIQLYNFILPCGIIFSIWINDTMAYLVGSFIGKTPLSKISPKKTWEGTAGGALLCVVLITLAGWLSNYFNWQTWLGISAACAIFGTIGDLIESKLKRMAGVKDSGSIMPGHGGFLDRFDSLLAATPFVWLVLFFLNK